MVSEAGPERPSFAAVAERRFRLAGKSIIEKGHPYFVPVDRLEQMYSSKPDGYVSLAHYDYLGLSRHPEVIGAASEAVQDLGAGAGASRLVGGERTAHRALERNLAEFLGVGDVLTLISGYLTNLSLINHLLGPRDLVLIDSLAHNSIVVGAKSGRFECRTFEHNDLDDLERQLDETRHEFRHVLVVVEGLYSMDGDIPDLPRLVEMKTRHDAWLLVDEAHSYGVLGEYGRGITEHFGIDPAEIELSVGTLSKSFVSSGGFICASAEVIAWLRFTLPGFVYSVGLSPATVASANAAVNLLRREPERVARLKEKSRLFRDSARAAGLNPGCAIGEAVVPLFFDSPEQTMLVSQVLMDHGIYAPPIVQVGVPKDRPRIRFFFSAAHRDADILRAVDVTAAAVHGELPAQIASS
ncbi:aminotransferase class I/II-fold pyridoxal phosphate-dependent enzyme [Psychromarinibacter sp. C21-152]|uniref:Aminotransferase class I/II-fold pyridoxal phosphate-dependent enzyme n=1 Tax=Psychromarinibacter sediminicola TaxID=3033385 RepID=A0AAE3TB57_9RHOB|nr:aminotransferase class I/II-fold pyridoxal phosphate-dependent enzyme [Psychromarinibacter sediminicola]MDF0603488.1 aminotransferase class I/II-fold pyridoxal phosphate-dependent enzyme [Psychromarinibacter sediminicola]